MLTAGPHPRAVLAALLPTARRARLAMVAVTCALGCTPAVVRLAEGRPASSLVLVAAAVVAGSAVAWATEDPGRELFGSLPVASPVRTAIRLGCACLLAAAVVASVVAALTAGPGVARGLGARVPEALAAAALGAAHGLVLTRRGERAGGALGVIAGLGGVLLVASLAHRWPAVLPALDSGPVHARWWLIATLGGVVALWAARDPAR